jgi:S-adenosylmethionine decarboxylase
MNLSLDTMENKGRHVFLDFVNFYDNNLEQCCQDVFEIMQDSLKLTKMRNMHSKMIILKDDTEEGFTSVILLDESHITCHSYTKLGLLALDVFTCGSTNPEIISNYIKLKLELKYPKIKCTNSQTHKRFLFLHSFK